MWDYPWSLVIQSFCPLLLGAADPQRYPRQRPAASSRPCQEGFPLLPRIHTHKTQAFLELPKESRCKKDLDKKVYCSFIPNNPGAHQEESGKQILAYLYTVIKTAKFLTCEPHSHDVERNKTHIKKYILCNSIYNEVKESAMLILHNGSQIAVTFGWAWLPWTWKRHR